MRRRRCGAIVNVGSGFAYRAIPLQSAYCGAKVAIRGFTEAIRAELIHDDLPISVSEVHLPGGRLDNLFTPAPGHQAAHGRFGRKARGRGVAVRSGTLRGGAIAGGALIALTVGVGLGTMLAH
jgi:NAD(P)-dependent dehydrogenase (short-subunit alcohol dehydrogenase family)